MEEGLPSYRSVYGQGFNPRSVEILQPPPSQISAPTSALPSYASVYNPSAASQVQVPKKKASTLQLSEIVIEEQLPKDYIRRLKCPNPTSTAGAQTFNGFAVSEVLQYLENSIKHGNLQDLYASVAELSMLRRINCKIGMRSLYHQLSLIASSYLGVGNFQLCLDVLNLCIKLDKLEKEEVMSKCYSMAELMRSCGKNHLTPLLWNAYCNPEGVEASRSKGLQVVNRIEDAKLVKWRTVPQKQVIEMVKQQGLQRQQIELLICFNVYLCEGSFNCLGFLAAILEYEKSLNLRKGAQSQTSSLPYLMSLISGLLSQEIVDLFSYWYLCFRHPYFLVTLVTAAILGLSEFKVSQDDIPTLEVNEEQFSALKKHQFQQYPPKTSNPLHFPIWEPIWPYFNELQLLEQIAKSTVNPWPPQ